MEKPNVVEQEQQQQSQCVTTQAAQKSNKKKSKNKNRQHINSNENNKNLVDVNGISVIAKNSTDSMNRAKQVKSQKETNSNCGGNDGAFDKADEDHEKLTDAVAVNGLSEQLKHKMQMNDPSTRNMNNSHSIASHNGDVSNGHVNVDHCDANPEVNEDARSTSGCHSNLNSHASGSNAKKPRIKSQQQKQQKKKEQTQATQNCHQGSSSSIKNGKTSVQMADDDNQLEQIQQKQKHPAKNQSTENNQRKVQSLEEHKQKQHKNKDKSILANNNNNGFDSNCSGSSSSKHSIKSIHNKTDNTSATCSSSSNSSNSSISGVTPTTINPSQMTEKILLKNGSTGAPSSLVAASMDDDLVGATVITDSDTATASEASPSASSLSSSPTSSATEIDQNIVANSVHQTPADQSNSTSIKASSSLQDNDKEQEQQTLATIISEPKLDLSNVHIEYKEYESELQMHDIMRLIQAELSEPYSIYTYRYFIYNWPKLCFLAAHGNEYVGAIVCKLDMHMNVRRGYIAMLAVRKEYRKLRIGTTLVQKAIEAMLADKADEVVLETEMRNEPALRLYENLGFVRDKRLFRYYLNGVDALRLKLWFR